MILKFIVFRVYIYVQVIHNITYYYATDKIFNFLEKIFVFMITLSLSNKYPSRQLHVQS